MVVDGAKIRKKMSAPQKHRHFFLFSDKIERIPDKIDNSSGRLFYMKRNNRLQNHTLLFKRKAPRDESCGASALLFIVLYQQNFISTR
jgi:hypothetical protein